VLLRQGLFIAHSKLRSSGGVEDVLSLTYLVCQLCACIEFPFPVCVVDNDFLINSVFLSNDFIANSSIEHV